MPVSTKPIAVEIDSLRFSYPDNPETEILSSISLRIEPGSMVAFIGSSGAGKSTIASLILGLLIPSSGSVTLQGLKPRDFVYSNPGSVSLVQQTSSLVFGSIAENIALGVAKENIDMEALERAIRWAELGDWVSSLEDGIDSIVDSGVISGGQLQRIGLARALYTNPGLLVLDEPTSSLDADTENRIATSLQRLRGQVTQIVIAHRLTTIEDADVVYLIEAGKVAASGSFSELRRTSPTVARQVELLTFKS